MKSKQNHAPFLRKVHPKALALASGLAIAATGSSAPNASANTQREAPQQALARVITQLEEGKAAQVTTAPVKLAGSIGVAVGRPIIFKDGDQSYFAYTQGTQPNFSTSPEETASTMAIVDVQLPSDAGTKIPVTEAHLNAKHVLTEDGDHAPVGYALGGGN
jgi:hypothetical protein